MYSVCLPELFVNLKSAAMFIKRKMTTLMVCSLLGLGFLSCDHDDDEVPKTTYTLSAAANGANEVPAVSTAATGSLTGNYNSTNNTISYTVNWTGLSANASNMHFHGPALAGASAPPAVNITGFSTTTSGSLTGTATLTDAQEEDLLAGKWYWNVHTSTNQNGEIRGQVTAQ
jgi:hypothetical protein